MPRQSTDPGLARGSQGDARPTSDAPLHDNSAGPSSQSARPRRSGVGRDYRQLAGKTPKSELEARQTPGTSRESSAIPKEGSGLKLKFSRASGKLTCENVDEADGQAQEADSEMSRSKARNGGSKEENEEESAIYSQVINTLKKLSGIQNRQKAITAEITELEKNVVAAENNRDEDAGPARAKLETLYRELLKLTSEERALLCEEPHDLIKNTEILSALRSHTENNQRAAPPPPPKIRKGKGSKSDIDASVESPGPASAIGGSSTRIKAGLGRSGSVPFSREPKEAAAGPSKMGADDAASASSGADGARAERAGKLVMGAEVAYKQARPKEDGSQWIQCTIISINEVGNNKKSYRVQDTEPDEQGRPGEVYKAWATALIAIPPEGSALPDYPNGKHVLARYPETTTFYRAEVTGMKKDICKLKFEDDMNQEMEVDRRYVLDMTSK